MAADNVAIILAVSKYDNANSLPGCKNDGSLIRTIVQRTGKFAPENTLFIDNNTTSGHVKSELSRFVAEKRAKGVAELFFYYTGHGLFDGTNYFYLLSDYSPTKTQVTALTNEELDNMLRSLNSELAVKIIDACYSAQQYVKSADEFRKAITATGQAFKHCYFMFSSEQNQQSWQDNALSYFTLEIARAIHQHTSPAIRYKDMIDFVSDSFTTNARQKPVFVTQANFTDEFCPVDDALRQAIAALLPPATTTTTTTTTTGGAAPAKRPIVDVLRESVRKEAERYCTEEEAINTLAGLKSLIEGYKLPNPITEFYRIRPTFMTEQYAVPNDAAIGEWLKDKTTNYFAKILYKEVPYTGEEPVYKKQRGLFLVPDLFPEYREVTRYKSVPSGFETTQKLPFKSVHILVEPTLNNLPWWRWYLAFIVSKDSGRCFHTSMMLKEINWKERTEEGSLQWRIREFPLKDANLANVHIATILNQLAQPITQHLMEKYGLEAEQPLKKDESPQPAGQA